MKWPDSELEWQAAFFSIDTNKDKPSMKLLTSSKRVNNVKDEIQAMKSVLTV